MNSSNVLVNGLLQMNDDLAGFTIAIVIEV